VCWCCSPRDPGMYRAARGLDGDGPLDTGRRPRMLSRASSSSMAERGSSSKAKPNKTRDAHGSSPAETTKPRPVQEATRQRQARDHLPGADCRASPNAAALLAVLEMEAAQSEQSKMCVLLRSSSNTHARSTSRSCEAIPDMSTRTWGHRCSHPAAGLLAGPEEDLQQRRAR
jgi:hypothetical protein